MSKTLATDVDTCEKPNLVAPPSWDSIPRVTIVPKRLAQVLAAIASLLVVAGCFSAFLRIEIGYNFVFGLVPLFDLNAERSVPASFSSSILVLAAAQLGLIAIFKAQVRDRWRRHWTILSLGFLYLAVDESASIHEKWVGPVKDLLGERAPEYAWVAPGMLLVIAFAFSFFRFWRQLPGQLRMQFLIAAVLLVGGGVGVETIAGEYASLHGMDNLPYVSLTLVEESLEMSGVIVFIVALTHYLQMHCPKILIAFRRD